MKMAGFGFDSGYGQAVSYGGEAYLVLQVVLTEKFLGTGSGVSSLSNLQNVINEQAAKGYRLHTITTASSGSKGWLGGDKIQATMVFERMDLYLKSNGAQNPQPQGYPQKQPQGGQTGYCQQNQQGYGQQNQQGYGQQNQQGYNQTGQQGAPGNNPWYKR